MVTASAQNNYAQAPQAGPEAQANLHTLAQRLPNRWQPQWPTADLAAGQMVLVTGRWLLVIAGFGLLLLQPNVSLTRLRLEILMLAGAAVLNFYLFTQALQQRPTLQIITYVASLADLVIITVLVKFSGGFFSPLYVFYYPALLIMALAFPRPMLLIFTETAVLIYTLTALSTQFWYDNVPAGLLRLVVMVAVVECGYRYGQIERQRRQPPPTEPVPTVS